MTYIAFVLAIFTSVLVLNSGCEEELNQSSVRKSRLIADENLRLTAELKQLNRQLDEQIKLLEECREEKEKFEKDSKELTSSIMTSFSECSKENLQLQKGNEKLKAKLKQLQDESD